MPAWDNCLDQIESLPLVTSIDPAADLLLHIGGTRSAGQAAALRDVPHALVWSLQGSAPNSNPTTSTTVRKDGFAAPYDLTAMRLVLSVTTAYGSSKPWFDLADETAAPFTSLLTGLSPASGRGVSLATGTDTVFVDDPVDNGIVSASRPIGLFCSAASSTNLGSTWGQVIYVLS